MSELSAAPTPSFRGRGRGRGRSQAVRAHVARLAQARKAANGRRGRQKLYDHPKPQAASERLKELKAAFSTVANALRPALEDLADRNLDQLKSQPNVYREVPEFEDVKSFIDTRFREVQDAHNNRLLFDTRLKDYIYEESSTITRDGFIRDIEDAKERFIDAQLQRLDVLEQLHDNELPIDIIDDSWNFREISDERFRDVKAHVEYRTDLGYHPIYGNKVEVPCAKTITGRRIIGDDSLSKPSLKRKADGEADIMPAPKRLIGGSAPRHIGGLLSAVVAPTDDDADDAEGAASPGRDSKVPSPSPALAEEDDEMLDDDENGTPMGDEEDLVRVRPSDRLPPLPNGASEPDAFGVRLINKRRTANFDVYNRILVPALFDFEPHEIGFRDSTNDKSRGATKIKRGRFLDTPNSNTMHFDRSLWQYDATTYDEGELDEELIKKYNLHPKHGLVLRTSTNDEEPPKKRVSGKNSIVFYTPYGRTLISSRSIRIARLEDGAILASKKPAMVAAVDQFVEREGLEPAQINPPDDILQEFREAKLKLWLGARRATRDETEELEDRIEEVTEDYTLEEDEDKKVDIMQKQQKQSDDQQAKENEQDSYDNIMTAKKVFGVLLDAANASAAARDTDDEATHLSSAMPSSPPPRPPPRRAASRPFDPVRDVFLDQTTPSNGSADLPRQSSTDIVSSAGSRSSQALADASNLLYMASLASDQEYVSAYHHHQPSPRQHTPYHYQQAPQLLPPQAAMQYPSSRGASQEYVSAESNRSSYPPPARRMSMDPPQPYHAQPSPQHSTPQQQHQLLDPRLFGEAAIQQQQLTSSDAAFGSNREPSNGYSSSGYYQQQASGYMPSGIHQSALVDPYGPPPPSSISHPSLPPPQSHGMAPMSLDASPSRVSRYYMSPPPQSKQVSSQSPLPIMQPYDSRFGPSSHPSRSDLEGGMPPPHVSYGQQSLPPPPAPSSHMQGPPPPPAYQHSQRLSQPPPSHGPPSPNMYSGQPPAYARGGSREYQPRSYHASSRSPPPSFSGANNSKYHHGLESLGGSEHISNGSNGNGNANGSNNNNSYRKLEPAPLTQSGGSEWPASDRDGNNAREGTAPPVAVAEAGGANMSSGTPTSKELHTVPYDYEKIKDYAAIEPPPNEGPRAIRGWAHNGMKRGSGSGKGASAAVKSETPE